MEHRLTQLRISVSDRNSAQAVLIELRYELVHSSNHLLEGYVNDSELKLLVDVIELPK